MPAIAIIDDEIDLATNLRNSMRLARPMGWHIEAHSPLEDATSYPEWVKENDVWALILDWHLDEHSTGGRSVGYRADAVISAMRKAPAMREFPIYVATSYADTADHQIVLKGSVEDFLDRDQFAEDAAVYTARVIRAANRFQKTYLEMYGEFERLATLAARGLASEADIRALRNIQTDLDISILEGPSLHFRHILVDAEEKVTDLEALLKEISVDLEKA